MVKLNLRVSEQTYHEILLLKQRVELATNARVSFDQVLYDVCLALKRTDALALLCHG